MALRLASIFILWEQVQSGFIYPFCTTGISTSRANFSDNDPVEVIFAQAPLFSSNPSVGQKGKYLNLYHTCIVLAQGAGTSRRYWTLEFDFTGGNLLQSIAPHFSSSSGNASSMVWHNDARYCLTEGLLWGEKHWSKSFRILFAVPADQIRETFTNFIGKLNSTNHDSKPQYQLWRVAKKWPDSEMLVKDTTCADGALWFLHHLTSTHNALLPHDFVFRATVTQVNAASVNPVDLDNAKMVGNMVRFFRTLADFLGANKSIGHRLLDAFELAVGGKRYVYDPNNEVYYEISGNMPPWIHIEYPQYELMGPPWMEPNSNAAVII